MSESTLQYESEALDWAAEATVADDGLVSNVALCGMVSKNGYSFAESAFGDAEKVKSLYGGRPVFIDHPKDADRPTDRSSRDLAGTVENVQLRNGRPFGNVRTIDTEAGLHFRKLAKSKPANVGMSHVAQYTFNKGRTRVESVDRVASVDLVVFPATTKSFSEQDRGSSMADTDKFTTHLETEKTRLQGELDKQLGLVRDKDTEITKLKADLATAQGRVTTLESENKTLKTEADGFKAEKAIGARRISIEAKLKEHGLKADDKAVISDVFMESLVAEADEAKREKLILDRKAIFENAAKNSGGGVSFERSSGGGSAGGFDTAAYWNNFGK